MQGYKHAEYQATGGKVGKEAFAAIGIYRTADGYIAISVTRDEQVLDLLRAIGLGHLADDDRFSSPASRFDNQDALRAEIELALSRESKSHWIPLIQSLDVICQEVHPYDAFRKQPQVLHQKLFDEGDLGEVGCLPSVRMPGLPPDGPRSSPAPRIGEHTRQVLEDFGIGHDEVQAWLDTGVAVQAA